MTAPANRRRKGDEKAIDRAFREQGLPPPGDAETTRKSPRGKRLERLRKRKAKG